MKINERITLLMTCLMLSACDVTDSIIDSANSALKQKDIIRTIQIREKEQERKRVEIIGKIKRSIQYDLISNVEKKLIEQNLRYDEILLQDFDIGEYQEVEKLDFSYPVEIKFAVTHSVFGVKSFYKFQGHMYYSLEGEFKKITWTFVGKTTDASEFRRNAETVGKIYENLKEKE